MKTFPTPYDTGDRHEPAPWVDEKGITGQENRRPAADDDYGRVDFNDNAGITALNLWVEPDLESPEQGVVLQVEPVSAEVRFEPVGSRGIDEIVADLIEETYGEGAGHAEPNIYGEVGLTLALAQGDVDADDIVELMRQAAQQARVAELA